MDNVNYIPKLKLKSIRKAKGFKQSELAEMVLMDQSQYSRREQGKIPITNEEWERISKVL